MIARLGTVDYRAALELQESLRRRGQARAHDDALPLLAPPPVYTLGRRSTPQDLPMGEAWYRAQGIDIVPVDRGGGLTYHGPGQLVAYPVMRISDVPGFVHAIERAIVATLGREGIAARARE